MSELLETCPVCDTKLGRLAQRCPACGKVFGEANRCPRCHVIAAVREVGRGQYVCAACNAPRERLPGTPLDSDFADELTRRASRDRLLSIVGWVVGVPLALSGVGLLAFGYGLLEGGWQWAFYIVGAPLSALGAVGTWLGRRLGKRARERRASARDARLVLAATRSEAGATAADVARALSITTVEADHELTRLAKAGRVGLDVDDAGVVRYRVADPELEEALTVGEEPGSARRAKN